MIDNKMHANHRGGDRQSNIEVLRLLSMLMVLNLIAFGDLSMEMEYFKL